MEAERSLVTAAIDPKDFVRGVAASTGVSQFGTVCSELSVTATVSKPEKYESVLGNKHRIFTNVEFRPQVCSIQKKKKKKKKL
mmetsp:Transcript_351/g.226  ORF Transcript_351/g.226 Transcript_351/m.226 type:complete len:83 (+) Transcript_351:80-328(+)